MHNRTSRTPRTNRFLLAALVTGFVAVAAPAWGQVINEDLKLFAKDGAQDDFFGLSIEQGAGELPDHVTTELEFMHFLTFKELVALRQSEDAAPCRRAQADFLERQLVSWLPALEERLQKLEPPTFYVALVWLTNAVARAELDSLRQTLERTATIPLEARS